MGENYDLALAVELFRLLPLGLFNVLLGGILGVDVGWIGMATV
jgi:hypothetical protein